MLIYDHAPAACASRVRDAVGLLAEAFRKKGAIVEIIEQERSRSYAIVMSINLRCSPAEAEMTAHALEGIAKQSRGNAHSTLHSPFPTDLPDGEYGFGLVYVVHKAPSGKRLRAA